MAAATIEASDHPHQDETSSPQQKPAMEPHRPMDTINAASNIQAPHDVLPHSAVENRYEDSKAMDARSFQLIEAPHRQETSAGNKTIFLSGSTLSSRSNWQAEVAQALSRLPITVFNPLRPDWDSSWVEDIQDLRFRNQVEWELDHMEKADLVFIYFASEGLSAVSMFEFGNCLTKLYSGTGTMLVCCEDGYARRGNVQIVCARHGIKLLETMENVVEEIQSVLAL